MSTETENGTALIFDKSGQAMFLELTAGASALPAQISASQENEQDLTETDQALSERCSVFLANLKKKTDPNGLSTRMLRECCRVIEGGDFLSIILAMEELGYDIEWQVFNSKYHGVPQNRERVYTLGHLRTRGERKVFPLKGADEEDSAEIKQIGQQKAKRNNPNRYRCYDQTGIAPTLGCMEGGGLEPHTAIPMFGIDYTTSGHEREIANALTTRNNVNGVGNFNQDGTAVCVPMCIDPQGRTSKEVKPSDTAPTLRAQAHGNNPEICIPVLTPDRAEKRQNGRRFKDNGEEAFTLTAQDRHGVAISEVNGVPVIWYEKYNCYIAIRKLTPKECFRLQGWTDDYFEKAQFVNSDSQLYKQAGNGVTVNVVKDIARAIGECKQ